MRMKSTILGLSVMCMMVPSFATQADAAGSAAQKEPSIVADWKFSKQYVKSGTLENGNELELNFISILKRDLT